MSRVVAEVLPQERQTRILDVLQREGRAVASELAASFGVSEDSIRRDLRELASRGLCTRVYGGALPPTPSYAPLEERVSAPQPARAVLAAYAVSLIRPGQVLLLDAGSTNVEIARAIPDGLSITVITNAPSVANQLMGKRSVELVVIGGRVDPVSGGAIGSQAVQQLESLQADLCFPGACAVDPELGAWGMNSEEAAFKQAMVRASSCTVIVATDDKVGARGRYRIVGMDDVDHLIVSDALPDNALERFASSMTKIHRVKLA